MHLNGRNCCAVYSKSRVVDSAFPARSAPIFRGYPSPSAVQPAPPKGKPLAYRAGPAEHTGLFCVNVRALSSLADISSSKAWSMNFALHSFAVRFFFSKRSFDTTSPSMLRIATSPCRRGLGSPHRVSGFARGSPTRRAVERERD